MKKEKLSQESAEETKETNSASTLVEMEDIPDSPFTLVKAEFKYFIALGKYRLTDLVDDANYLRVMVKEKDWRLILGTILTIVNEQLKEK